MIQQVQLWPPPFVERGTNSSHCWSSRANQVEGLSVSFLIFVMIVFKVSRKRHGWISAWFIFGFLAPEIENIPPEIILIIVLNSYKVHLIGSVLKKIEDLGAEIWHIPGGCKSSSTSHWDIAFVKDGKIGWSVQILQLASPQPARMLLIVYHTFSNEIVRHM